jgi:hypothetical protein
MHLRAALASRLPIRVDEAIGGTALQEPGRFNPYQTASPPYHDDRTTPPAPEPQRCPTPVMKARSPPRAPGLQLYLHLRSGKMVATSA